VDPLDGTKEFVKRNDEFCINIALVEKGKAILGVILTPAKGQAYYAYENGGAWQWNPGGSPIRYRSSLFSWKNAGLRFITSRSHMNTETTTFIRGFAEPIILQRGSAIKFVWISRGDADAYPKFGRTMEWDSAAGQILLEEAGGQVLEYSTRNPLRYNKKDLANPHFIAHGKTS
jgi:3'(2'), 5'-bisphosphate nucleotidase